MSNVRHVGNQWRTMRRQWGGVYQMVVKPASISSFNALAFGSAVQAEPPSLCIRKSFRANRTPNRLRRPSVPLRWRPARPGAPIGSSSGRRVCFNVGEHGGSEHAGLSSSVTGGQRLGSTSETGLRIHLSSPPSRPCLTLPSRRRPTSGFASCRPRLMSNVRAPSGARTCLQGRRGSPAQRSANQSLFGNQACN